MKILNQVKHLMILFRIIFITVGMVALLEGCVTDNVDLNPCGR